MKKRILIALMLISLLLYGCTEKKPAVAVGVLGKEEEDKACLVFIDEDNNPVKSIEIKYPASVFFDAKRVYYCLDEVNFESIRISDFKKDISVNNVGGYLMCVNDDGSFFVQGEQLEFVKGDTRTAYDYTIMFSRKDDKCFYIITMDGELVSFDLESGKQLEMYTLYSYGYMNLAYFDDTVYLVSEVGYNPLKDGKMTTTYIYQEDIGEIRGVFDRYLSTMQDDGNVVYRVSFDRYSIILEMMYDNYYYRDYDFGKIFSEYYDKGYSIVNYYTFSYR
ncbi:MAG: hypothetical protein IJM15_04635 [Erysipelotrichaceae bacterium]|nr:hypothetical protein [Erysipelotrichaceae bacterium]